MLRKLCLSFLIVLFLSPLVLQGLKAEDSEPDPALELLYSANGLYNRKLYELAAEQYERFLEEHGRHEKVVEARFGYALSLFGAGRMEPAEKALAELAGDQGVANREQVYLLWGQSLLALERLGDAEEVFTSALGIADDKKYEERYLAGLVESLFRQKKAEELVVATERIVGLDGDSPYATRAQYQSGLLFYQAEDFAVAAEYLGRIAGRDESMDQQIYFMLGECHRKGGELEAAVDAYEASVGVGDGPHYADSLFRLGYVRFLMGEHEEAAGQLKAFLEESGEEHPANSQARFYLGRVYYEGGRFEDARKAFQELAEEPGFEGESALWTGKAYLGMENKVGEAVEVLERVAVLVPGSAQAAEAGQLLAYQYYRSKEYDKAARAAADFLEVFPENPAAVELLFLRGESVFLQGDHEGAIGVFEEFLKDHAGHEKSDAARLRLAQGYAENEEWGKVFELISGLEGEGLAPEGVYLGGVAAYRLEHWSEAAERLEGFTGKHSEHVNAPAALLLAALAHGNEDDVEAAMRSLEALVSRHRESVHRSQGMLELARLQVSENKSEDARRVLVEFLKDYPEHEQLPVALYRLGWIESDRDELVLAASSFGRLADEFPDHDQAADARLQQALMLEQAGELEKSREAIQAFLSRYENDPRRDQALYHNGYLLMALEQWPAARDQFMNLLNDYKESPLQDRALYQLAWVEREAGNHEEAGKRYEELTERFVESPLALNAAVEMAELSHMSGEHEKLIGMLEPLLPRLEAQPEIYAKGLYRLGLAYFGEEKYQQAARNFETLLEQEGESELAAAAAYQAGEARLRLREYDKARANYERVLVAKSAPATAEQAVLRLGEVEALLERWGEAQGYYLRLINDFSGSVLQPQAHLGLGWSLENQRAYEEAIAAYRVAAQRGGRTEVAARSQFQIGECFFAMEEYEEAIKELIKVEINYAFPAWSSKALLEIARSLERMGKTVEAADQYREVVEKYPDTTAAEVSREALKKLP